MKFLERGFAERGGCYHRYDAIDSVSFYREEEQRCLFWFGGEEGHVELALSRAEYEELIKRVFGEEK